MATITTQRRPGGRLEVLFDQPGSRVNTFSSPVLDELERLLDDIRADLDIRAVVFRSAKPGCFIAGADINELRTLTDPQVADAFIGRGQRLFSRLEALRVPTVSVIDGACLGGGLEFAMTTTWRLVSDDRRCALGLPEVTLGLIPGWGGTQRLPRLVGVAQALQMICSGRPVDGPRAVELGLATVCAARSDLDRALDELLAAAPAPDGPDLRMPAPAVSKEQTEEARQLVGRGRLHEEAPLAALDVVTRSARTAMACGLDVERAGFVDRVRSRAGRNLMRMFFNRDRLRKERWGLSAAPLPVERPAVLGAGTMGAGIAWALCDQGLPVTLRDVDQGQLERGMAAARAMYGYPLQRGRMTAEEVEAKLARIEAATDPAALADSDLVIEAVTEDPDLKKQVLRELEHYVGADTIIATNTSSLPIDELAGVLGRPERFVAVHFFNPVNRMPLVEIARAPATTDAVLATAVALARSLGKTPIVVGGRPGFVSNRVLFPYLLEALHLADDDDGIGDIDGLDRLAGEFGLPMGPYRLMDEIGIDVTVKIADSLQRSIGDRYRCPELARDLLVAGMLGRKSGQGFYAYGPGRDVQPNPTAAALRRHGNRRPASAADLHRCLALMANEASRCLEEGIVTEPMPLDMTMILGTGFPQDRGGILAHADDHGPERIAALLEELRTRHGERFAPSDLLRHVAKSGTRFYGDHPARETTSG